MQKIYVILPCILILFTLPTSADNIISRCSEIANNLNLSGTVCNGEVSGIEKQLKHLSSGHNSELIDLGIYLRQLGYLDAAKTVLVSSMEGIPEMDERYSEIKLSIANITYAEYKNAVQVTEVYDPELAYNANVEGFQKAQQAFKDYEKLWGTLQEPTSIKAALNWLKLWSDLDQKSNTIRDLKQSYNTKAIQLVYALDERLTNSKSSDENTNYRVNFAEALIQSHIPNFLQIAENHLDHLKVDSNVKPRTYSRIAGALGLLHQASLPKDAIKIFNQARQSALLGQYPELVYRWDAALGKLYRTQGKTDEARRMFQDAMRQIDVVRAGSVPFVRNVQYQSYEKVLPVYRDYLDLLFSEKEPDYVEILKVYEIEKRSELEYYLQCSQINAIGLSQLPQTQQADVTIYIIRRTASYEIVARFKNGSVVHHSVSTIELDKALTEAKKYTSSDQLKVASDKNLHSIFGNLYTLILAPFEKSLPPIGASITFVMDAAVQNIPLNALYTSDEVYLLQKYVVNYSPGIRSLSQESVSSIEPKVVVAGVSVDTDEFPALPAVRLEVDNISKIYHKARLLLNSDFKKEKFFELGSSANILHIASHSVFSSDPRETFILAWDGKIGLNELYRFGDASAMPLDLLFFSSCESSKGNPISVLGITGTSFRAGAHAAIASLWKIEDRSMAELATNFYRSLKEGKSKAEALRTAQVIALKSDNPRFAKFANWAGVGLYEQ